MVKVNLDCDHALIKSSCQQKAIKACEVMKRNYAFDLNLIHAAKINNGSATLIDCHFSNQLF